MATSLKQSALAELSSDVAAPAYDRAALTPGIVHVGVGNFHRAHQAVYLDDLFAQGLGHDWALVGAGVRQGDAEMRERLLAQDCLSTVVELDPGGHTARVIGAMIDFVPVEPENGALIAAMTADSTRIVSLTVTEGGYYLDGAGNFDGSHPDMSHDAAHPDAPRTVFGAILRALRLRREAGQAPFTVMSCDNLPGNGHVTMHTLSGLARLQDPALADWVAANVACPNSMVDRITPATDAGVRDRVTRDFGVADAAPVVCEPFRQWVMEDTFPLGRPPLEAVGVTFTDQVEAFEAMKIRILNGGHALIAYPSGLLGHVLVSNAMTDPLIRNFLLKVEREEVLPIVPPVPGTELPDYLDLIVERFANPEVGDTIRRLCLDGSNRQPKFIVPSIADNLRAGRVPEGLVLLSALWCRYCAGTDETGAAIAPNDPSWDQLTALAQEAREDPSRWLSMHAVYGDLARNADFAAAFDRALRHVWAVGTDRVLRDYLG